MEVPEGDLPCCSCVRCLLCGFACATCCGLKNYLAKKLMFAPPDPPFYDYRDVRGKMTMFRIPLTVYDDAGPYDKKG
jgi:hypothetical protein